MRSRTARVMTTLMRNGRDRRSENPLWADAILERVFLVGTDQRITSGPAATAAASPWGKPPRENRPYTWLHPNASQKSQIPLATRAPSIHGPSRRLPRCNDLVAIGGIADVAQRIVNVSSLTRRRHRELDFDGPQKVHLRVKQLLIGCKRQAISRRSGSTIRTK